LPAPQTAVVDTRWRIERLRAGSFARESLRTDSLARGHFRRHAPPIGPIGGKNFCTAFGVAADRSIASFAHACDEASNPAGTAVLVIRALQKPLCRRHLFDSSPRPSLRPSARRNRARCGCGGTRRRVDPSPLRVGVVHHSLSGFAVFCVLL
jgi:hypothetical protein